MYRCECCQSVSKPRKAELRHTILRKDGSIEREVKTCGVCLEALKNGVPLETLRTHHERYKAGFFRTKVAGQSVLKLGSRSAEARS